MLNSSVGSITANRHAGTLSEIALESPTNIAALTHSFMSFHIENNDEDMMQSRSESASVGLVASGLQHTPVFAFVRAGLREPAGATVSSAQHSQAVSVGNSAAVKRLRDSSSALGASALASSSQQLFASHLTNIRGKIGQVFHSATNQFSGIQAILATCRTCSHSSPSSQSGVSGQSPLSLQPAKMPLALQYTLQQKMVGPAPLAGPFMSVSGCAIVSGTALTLLVCTCTRLDDGKTVLLLQLYNDFASLPVGEHLVTLPRQCQQATGGFAPGGTGQCVVAGGGSVILLDLASSWNMYLDSSSKHTQTITAWAVLEASNIVSLTALKYGSEAPRACDAAVCSVAAASGSMGADGSAGRTLLVTLGHKSGSCTLLHISGTGDEVSPAELKVQQRSIKPPGRQAALTSAAVHSMQIMSLAQNGYFAGGILLVSSLADNSQFHCLFSPSSGQLFDSLWTKVAPSHSLNAPKAPTDLHQTATAVPPPQSAAGATGNSGRFMEDTRSRFSRVLDIALASSDAEPPPHAPTDDYAQQRYSGVQSALVASSHLRSPHQNTAPIPKLPSVGQSLNASLHSSAKFPMYGFGFSGDTFGGGSAGQSGDLLLGSPTAAQGVAPHGLVSSVPQAGGGGLLANSFFLADSSSSYDTDFAHGAGADPAAKPPSDTLNGVP